MKHALIPTCLEPITTTEPITDDIPEGSKSDRVDFASMRVHVNDSLRDLVKYRWPVAFLPLCLFSTSVFSTSLGLDKPG